MEDQNWTEFRRRISIKADNELIFKYFSTPELIEKWFLSSARFWNQNKDAVKFDQSVSAGDSYEWMWHGSENVAEGIVLFNNMVDELKFTFLDCEVFVKVYEEEGESVLDLLQYEISTDEATKMNYYVECTRGWTFYLTNLKSILEGGIDLRNKNMKLKNVINT